MHTIQYVRNVVLDGHNGLKICSVLIVNHNRSIGVGESISLERLQPLARSDSSSPTGSVVGTIRRRIRTFEAGVQVTELDLGVKVAEPLLQIIEKIDRGTQSSEEGLLLSNTQKQTLEQRESEVKPTVKTKSVGTHARPRTLDVGVSIKVCVYLSMGVFSLESLCLYARI